LHNSVVDGLSSAVLSLVIAALVATGAVTISTAVVAGNWRLKA
jgi:hypothetical protein